jgi:ABC-2 type transport system permease protein
MNAIYKKELRSYFSSPIGYVCIAALAALYGFLYYQVMLSGSSSYVSSVYSTLFTFGMMVIPIITMKSFSEERKNKTDQALLTAPVSVTSIVLGKFLGAFTVYGIATVIGLIPAFVMAAFSTPPWGILFGNFIATLFYGAAMISIGIFISSLTTSQVIAAIGTYVIAVLLMVMNNLASALSGTWFETFVNWISFTERYTIFTQGTFSVSSCVFFLSVVAIFIFLTARKIESIRWN